MDWVANEKVLVGTLRVYGGKTYKCLQAHVTQADWLPDKTPAMWSEVIVGPPTPQPWTQPAGAHDAYKIGDRCTFGGHLWESKITANVWSPTAYPAGWKDLGVYP